MYAIVFHAHQKIDRVAYRHLQRLAAISDQFPTIQQILHFEGQNGPDATKLKNKTNVEQPWHFLDPFNLDDQQLEKLIDHHYHTLITALRQANQPRAAFEAAWLAHALVDGLTPAHHYPYEQQLEDLRGEAKESRRTLFSRVLVKGETTRESVLRSLKLVGPKGLLTTHTMFEAGAYSIIAPLSLQRAQALSSEMTMVLQEGLLPYFRLQVRHIVQLHMYSSFYEAGWTPRLARQVRQELAPAMVKTVTLAWYGALVQAGLVTAP